MPAVPPWFTTEVAGRLRKVKRSPGSLQHYACCPVLGHDDQHASMGIKPGDSVTLIYSCRKGCTAGEIRDALAGLGVPEEYLGVYGTPEYEVRRAARAATGEDRSELDRLRNELAGLRNSVRGLLVADLTLAQLKVRLLSVVDDEDIPTPRKDYVAFAKRAGVSQPRAYEAWKVDPLVKIQTPCVSEDNVVLAHPEEKRQASQVTGDNRIIEPIKVLSKRERQNSRNDNSRNEKTGDEAA